MFFVWGLRIIFNYIKGGNTANLVQNANQCYKNHVDAIACLF